ncbi:MAG: class I SAM-dependent methyltransferase [Chloroflexota bacterium]|nr:class I SAM-dependent methyltransferase [Chloroflexota bacterium]
MKKRRTILITGGLVLGAAASLLAYVARQRKDPSACPYALRFSLELPHPFVTRSRLREILSPEPDQRVLEIGPGTGYYALHAARWLEPDGTLDVLDIQLEMLEHTMRRAHALGISNIVPTRGDAQALPYPDGHFDAAYLVATLGEVPDKERALRELRRVLKRGGRLVVGEVLLDPHRVSFDELRRLTETVGLDHERTLKGSLGYFAAFRAS